MQQHAIVDSLLATSMSFASSFESAECRKWCSLNLRSIKQDFVGQLVNKDGGLAVSLQSPPARHANGLNTRQLVSNMVQVMDWTVLQMCKANAHAQCL